MTAIYHYIDGIFQCVAPHPTKSPDRHTRMQHAIAYLSNGPFSRLKLMGVMERGFKGLGFMVSGLGMLCFTLSRVLGRCSVRDWLWGPKDTTQPYINQKCPALRTVNKKSILVSRRTHTHTQRRYACRNVARINTLQPVRAIPKLHNIHSTSTLEAHVLIET